VAAIAFRRLAATDFQSLYLWLSRPHVAKWYSNAPRTFPEMVAKYGPRTEASSPVRSFIVSVGGADCAYIQAYRIDQFPDYGGGIECARDAEGIDLFIGDAWRLGHGLGTRIVRLFLEQEVFAHGAPECFADPAEGNDASIRAFEKAGFARCGRVHPEAGEPQLLMRASALPQYRIVPMDLPRDAETCVRFRRDAYVATFGTREGMDDELGADNSRYLEYLRERISDAGGYVSAIFAGESYCGADDGTFAQGEGAAWAVAWGP